MKTIFIRAWQIPSYVFCKPDGNRYVEIKSAFGAALERAGIEDFKFHDLRHCFASALVQRGADLYEVQRLLGHKSHAMTQRYAHLAQENLRAADLKLDAMDSEVITIADKYAGYLRTKLPYFPNP